MKKLFIFFISIALLSGCKDELDQFPSDSLPGSEAITTVNDLRLAVNGVYRTLVDRYSYAGDFGIYADGRGGDAKIVDNSVNHFQPVHIFQLHANSGHSAGFYQTQYYAAARVNNVLLFVDGIEDKEDNLSTYNNYVGQLYAIRALTHFDLARLYAQLPSVASNRNQENSGIVLNNESFPVTSKFKRATLAETYQFIVNDLETSLGLLSRSKPDGSGAINYWAAKALLSRVYLYLEDYDNALKHAHEIIVDIDPERYSLYTRENFLTSWRRTGTSESLFELLISETMSAQRNSLGYYTDPNGYAEFAASDDFSTWILAQTDDIRSSSIRWKETSGGSNGGYYTMKYEGQEGVGTPLYVNNPKIIRLAEVYLIAAEAKLLGGNFTGSNDAVWYYNQLRSNRILNYENATSVTLDDILDERRREFFGENHRMFDLVRNRRTINHPSLGSIAYNDYRILVAIPRRELDLSPELKQNPEY